MRGVRMLPLVLLLMAACRGGDDADDTAADTTAAATTAAATSELLSPVRAVSIVEIETGQTAAQRAERAEVKQYAATVATDHRALVGILDSVAAAQGTQLRVTAEARELAELVRTAHSTTENLTGFDYDATFVRAEVEAQRQLLDRIDQELLPGATEPQTQTLLRDIRSMAEAHLTRARQLLNVLASAAPEAEPASPPVQAPPRPRPRPAETPPTFVPTVTDTVRPPVTTGPPVPPPPPVTTSG